MKRKTNTMKAKIVKYIVYQSKLSELKEFKESVELLLDLGYTLIGGPFIAGEVIYQALTRTQTVKSAVK